MSFIYIYLEKMWREVGQLNVLTTLRSTLAAILMYAMVTILFPILFIVAALFQLLLVVGAIVIDTIRGEGSRWI